MAKNDNVLTIRLSEDVIAKFEVLMNDELATAQRTNENPKGKKEIIEDAIKELYYKRINKTQDADVVDRVNGLVKDSVNNSMISINRKIDEILFVIKKIELGNKLIYRSPGIIPPPTNINDCIEVIVNERSGWNDALDEYMLNAWRSNLIKNHLK